jgi:hypothetical protein
MLSLDITFIVLTISRINNTSFAIANQTIKSENDYNIIAFAYRDCFLKAIESIKNIEKLEPEIFLAANDLSYKNHIIFAL